MHSARVVLLDIPNGHNVFVPEKKRPSCMYELERVLNVLTALDKNGEHHALFSHMYLMAFFKTKLQVTYLSVFSASE
jgi:hypothetical protein